ncbi:hypothetical protein [Achromobacter aloeverae]|uniref:Uncharacterized protein n=1 Tax=Achromobacter aloeverae TaxID=1750518 RepID=A0A4Q1HI89_9BURK|nr:hypothetical protein [Achromobacter aloeverae]RXN87771.1 hypothetical protein C7R54_14320 [Achromobacter aloeverae]
MASYVNGATDDLSALASTSGGVDPLSRVLNAAQSKVIPPGGLAKDLNTVDLINIQRNVNRFQLFVTTVSSLMKAFFDVLKGVARNLTA